MPRGLVQALALAGALICLSVPGAADAGTLGPVDLTANQGGTYACVNVITCTMANVQLPDAVGKERAPFSGRIKKWRVNIPPAHDSYTNNGPLALQVLKRTSDEPGLFDDEYVAVRESEYEGITPNSINILSTNLRIRKGQFIGLAHGDEQTEVVGGGAPGFMLWFEPALVLGEPGAVGDITQDNDYFAFNAKLVRD
jgi:hypothetical protein